MAAVRLCLSGTESTGFDQEVLNGFMLLSPISLLAKHAHPCLLNSVYFLLADGLW